MAIVSLTTIKNWFKTGLKPTQSQFWDVWDSFRHKSDAVPLSEIEGLDAVLLAQDIKINAIALPDDIIKEGALIVTSTTVDIIAEDFIWRLLQVQYTNLAAFHSVLPLTTSGYNRTDIFVGTNLGTIYRVQGEQVVGVSFKPDLPDGTIELAYIDVESTAVGVPVIPKPRYPVSQSLRDGITDYAPSENVVFDALALKLDASDYNEYFKGKHPSSAALIAAHPTSIYGAYAVVDAGVGSDAKEWIWDNEVGWIISGSTGAATTDSLTEGSTNLYFTVGRFLANLTTANVKAALEITTLSGNNTGDQDVSGLAPINITVVKIGANTTLDNTYNGKVILLTASCTLTLPNGLALGFNYSVKTRAGVTLTYALGGSVVLMDNTGTTMAEKLSHTMANTGVLNEYLSVGNL